MTTGRENEAARGLVQAALPHLEQQLARHGLSCERLSVAVGSFDGGDAPHGVEVKQAAVTATHKGAAGQETFLGFVSLRESVPRAAGTGNGGVPARPEAGEAPGSGAGVAPLQESGRPNRSGLGDLPWGGEAGGREIGTPAVQQGAAEAGGTEAPRPVVLAREIVHQGLAVWQKGYGQVRLKLHPEALGEVRLEVTSRAGRIAAHLVVENEAARSLVQAALPHLQQQLADHGLTCERFSVEVGNFGGGGYERGSGSSGGFGKSTPGSGSSWATEGRGSGTKDQVFSLVEYWV
ncbi:MAG: flagellar hook-length control protein FliK [Clostridia bacterium]|nr:flagellar hook-length control protein FliK [Clostridia bacterium]